MSSSLLSTITLISELFISAIIYYTLYSGYKHNKFPSKPAGFALLYEAVFNISYMVSRVPSHVNASHVESAFTIVLAATHGILSLIMFIALIVFFIFAWKGYKKGENFFQKHKILTLIFTLFWTISILSGILFYIDIYLL